MGHRLYASIPNVDYQFVDGDDDRELELGKQYDDKWYIFNQIWFDGNDNGLIEPILLKSFLESVKEYNDKILEYKLYNISLLEKAINYCIENKYCMYFRSL